MLAPKAAVMKVDPFHCDCPGQHQDLTLIETRFEGQHCFADLQCRVCHALWTAELSPTPGDPSSLSAKKEDQPGWRVLSFTPRRSH